MALTLQPENGTPAISLSNVFSLMDTHGKLMGAIHAVVPSSTADAKGNEVITIEHFTSLFFSKGFQYTATGFSLGYDEDKDSDEKLIKLFALQTILNMIPGLAGDLQSCDLTKYGTPNDLELDSGLRVTVFYAFGIAEEKRMPVLVNTSGFGAWQDCVELLKEKDEIVKTLEFLRD